VRLRRVSLTWRRLVKFHAFYQRLLHCSRFSNARSLYLTVRDLQHSRPLEMKFSGVTTNWLSPPVILPMVCARAEIYGHHKRSIILRYNIYARIYIVCSYPFARSRIRVWQKCSANGPDNGSDNLSERRILESSTRANFAILVDISGIVFFSKLRDPAHLLLIRRVTS